MSRLFNRPSPWRMPEWQRSERAGRETLAAVQYSSPPGARSWKLARMTDSGYGKAEFPESAPPRAAIAPYGPPMTARSGESNGLASNATTVRATKYVF